MNKKISLSISLTSTTPRGPIDIVPRRLRDPHSASPAAAEMPCIIPLPIPGIIISLIPAIPGIISPIPAATPGIIPPIILAAIPIIATLIPGIWGIIPPIPAIQGYIL